MNITNLLLIVGAVIAGTLISEIIIRIFSYIQSRIKLKRRRKEDAVGFIPKIMEEGKPYVFTPRLDEGQKFDKSLDPLDRKLVQETVKLGEKAGKIQDKITKKKRNEILANLKIQKYET